MTNRISARRANDAEPPRVDTDPAVVTSFLTDAAHVAGGFSAGVAFPTNEGAVAALVARADRVLPVGAQSSLTGGATPRGEIVLSTRALTTLAMWGPPVSGTAPSATAAGGPETITAGAGVPLIELQRAAGASGLWYPPVPTFEGAFVGGVISTNAAGAATFKYGATRGWVNAITVVLASGDVLDLVRGGVMAADGRFEIVATSGHVITIPVPGYTMPAVAKLSAGYFARPAMDLIDLFIGSEGTLGVITSATLRLVARPRRSLALIRCDDDARAIAVAGALRREAASAWTGTGPLDIAAVEYMDARAVRAVPPDAFAKAGVGAPRPEDRTVLLLVQMEMRSDEDASFERLQDVLSACGVADDPVISPPGDDRAAQRLLDVREAVPASVNALVGAAKAADPAVEKTAGDMVVPFERLADSLALYREVFSRRGLDHAIWGHLSDGNLHPNVIPRTVADVERGREALLEIAHGVMAMGGAPLAEHGVGRSVLKQRLLRELYGEAGIDEMRAVKRALDPGWKLSPGVLFSP